MSRSSPVTSSPVSSASRPAHRWAPSGCGGDLLAQLGGADGEAFGGLPGPEAAEGGAGDDAVVAAAAPVTPCQPERGDHLVLGEQPGLVHGGGQLFPPGGQVVHRGGPPSRRLQIMRRQHAQDNGLVDLDDSPAEGTGELPVVVRGGPARGGGLPAGQFGCCGGHKRVASLLAGRPSLTMMAADTDNRRGRRGG
jgi:hypothetical protein